MPTLSDIDGLLGPIGMMQSGLVIFFCVPSLMWIMQFLPKASLVERKTYLDFFKGEKMVYCRECVLKLKTNLPLLLASLYLFCNCTHGNTSL